MKKYIKIICTIGMLIVICLTLISQYNKLYYKAVTSFGFPNFHRAIIIDAGHGGVDPGKIGNQGAHEKDLNLKIAQKLRYFIEESGGVAILTRCKDEGLYTGESDTLRQKKNEDLQNRRKLIQESNGDIFISIHLNSFSASKYYGAQTFYLTGDEESKVLAEYVQDELIEVLNRGNHRKIKPSDSYYILKENGIPSILVEGGFLSNPEEERLLNDEEYQNKIAWSIYIGIMKYFSYVDQVTR